VTLVFLDTETTGLADDCDVWEIGLIYRTIEGTDLEHSWLLRPNLSNAEPTRLRIGRYYQRIGPLAGWDHGHGKQTSPGVSQDDAFITESRHIAKDVALLLDGTTIVGAVPDFDDRHLRRWLRAYDQAGTWHYHLVDVETLAAGALKMSPPWNFDKLLGEFGLTYDEADRHTALGDARMVRDLYDAVLAAQ
jgi:hypothetical protein